MAPPPALSHRGSMYRRCVCGLRNIRSTERLKQGEEFITSGRCNYLGRVHGPEINTTQRPRPSTLLRDGVRRRSLSIERSGLSDRSPFDLLVGRSNIRKEPLFNKRGEGVKGVLTWPLCLYELLRTQLIHRWEDVHDARLHSTEGALLSNSSRGPQWAGYNPGEGRGLASAGQTRAAESPNLSLLDQDLWGSHTARGNSMNTSLGWAYQLRY